jgi:hypothetical protein
MYMFRNFERKSGGMGETRSTCGIEDKCIQKICKKKNLKQGDHLEDKVADRNIILKCIEWKGEDWNRLAQGKDQRTALVKNETSVCIK